MPAAQIRIRSYNVGFGDCLLVTFPDGDVTRNMLIDFGNAPGQANTAYPEIAADIEAETNGHLDVVVMTHEHLDHLEGFYAQKAIFDRMKVDYVWMGLPSKPNYYTTYPKARPLRTMRELAAQFLQSMQRNEAALAPSFATLLRNNLSNPERIDYVRGLASTRTRVLYLSRGSSVRRKPFSDQVKVTILAPEKDVSVYYGGSAHHGLKAMQRRLVQVNGAGGAGAAGGTDPWTFPKIRREKGAPPNLTDREWRLLRASIQSGAVEAIRSIDKAANNTSLVFVLEVAGRRLLFPGDAELESWDMMGKKCPDELKPVDFLKVGHHGSHNGTPSDRLDDLLPKRRRRQAKAIVSTKSKVYGTVHPVPDKALLDDLKSRCAQLVNTDTSKKLWVDAVF